MKDCDIIQPELSAYVDGELSPRRRERVETHLASCAQCQTALAEWKALADGVAALPKLQPAPQFLAEVRRKIVRGDNPEALTWRDYLFRPFWIKLPLEIAAVAAVMVVVARMEQGQGVESAPRDQLAQADNSGNDQSVLSDMQTKDEPPAATESAPAPQAPVPAAAPESETATAPAGESMSPQEAPPPSENEAASTENRSSGAASESYQLPGAQAKVVVARSVGEVKTALESRRRVAAVTRGTSGLGIALAPSADEVSTAARSVGIEPSKLGGVVVVRSQDPDNVRGRAEQLAARCNGKVILVSPATGSTGQIFFVEVPREYAASFKLDMQQDVSSFTLATNAIAPGLAIVTTNALPLSATSTARVAGVLTGGVETNGLFGGPAQLTLVNNPRAQAAATTVLEILVMAPPSLAPTNATTVPVSAAH